MRVDKFQGFTEKNDKFGFVWPDRGRGYFFTWHHTLNETLDSIEADESETGPMGCTLARAKSEVRRSWREELRKDYGSLIPA